MSATYQCSEQELPNALEHAARVLGDDECIVLPTDTVYGIGCDAFSPAGVRALLAAKGRTRQMPPPVLMARPEVLDGLAAQVGPEARALAEAFWPGALTIVCWAQPTLGWDLGDTHGTVALRVPDDDVARAVLDRTGPMAVSSANRTGMTAAATASRAREMLGESVALYLEDGPRPRGTGSTAARGGLPSTIVDCTGGHPVVLRHGAIGLDRLREVVPTVTAGEDDLPAGADATPEPAPEVPGTVREDPATGPDLPGAGTGTATGGTESPQRPPLLTDPDASEEEVARALVAHSPEGSAPDVDQDRHRHPAANPAEPTALSAEEAGRLVNGTD